jgi:glucan phosphorylase
VNEATTTIMAVPIAGLSLRLYSGGLGILAGDHLKSASALDVPLVGVSLLYGEGYTVRVVPRDRGTGVPLDLPLIVWQR